MGEQIIHKISEIFVEKETRETDKMNREIILTPEESEFLLQATEGRFEKHSSLEGVEIQQLDIAKIPVDIQKKIEIIKGKIIAFLAIKIKEEVPLHQHVSDEEIYFGGKDGIVTLLDSSKKEIGKFDLSNNTYSVAKMGDWHGVKSEEGSTFFGIKYTTNEKEQIDMQFGGGVKLSMDYINAYIMVDFYRQKAQIEKMEPIQTYEEYFGKNPKEIPYILKLSDAKAIEKLNELVVNFNKDLDRIKEEKDIKAVEVFLDTIDKLMKEKK